VSENYPNLKADALFRDLQSQLEGTENRIAVSRKRYIDEVRTYNTTVRQFPTNITAMIFKMNVKPNFAVADEAAVSRPPTVDFGKSPGAPSTAPSTTPPATPPAPAAPPKTSALHVPLSAAA
jgi:LemA protein